MNKITFTDHEKLILNRLAQGLPFKAISVEAKVPPQRIARILKSIQNRTGCSGTPGCIAVAVANGIIDTEPFKFK